MRTGRPTNSDTIYKVSIHRNNGRNYASTQPYKIGEDGKKRYSHKHWGTVDENLCFHPGKAYFYAPIEERRKLLFPPDWDLSEIRNLSGNVKHTGVIAYEKDDVDRQYGATWLLDRVAEATGLTSDLKAVFDGNVEMVKDILTLAYFPFVDNLTYAHLARWQREVKAPSDRVLDSKAITYLTQSITEKHRMDLLRMRAKRLGKDELCAVDSTSMSSYGLHLVDIRWGHNKEKLPLKQTLEVVVYSLSSHMPVFYLELPGNMPDVRTAEMIIKELEHAGFKNLVLITDRGYESMRDLEMYIARGQKVISSVKVTQGEVLDIIRGIDMSKGYPAGMRLAPKEKLYYAQYDRSYSVKGNGDNVIHSDRLKINLYFNPHKRAEDAMAVSEAVEDQMSLAQAMSATKEAIEDMDSFAKECNLLKLNFDDSGHILSCEPVQEKIDRKLLTSGFFASKTLGLDLNPMQARDTYGMRDEQEKVFSLQKGPLGQDRLRTCSESSKRGRMFITFVGLILASHVRHVLKSNETLSKKFDSAESIIEEMRSIRCIEHKGHLKFITPFVGGQVDICAAFGFKIPEGCSPTYVSKAKSPTKRGRPAKPKTEKQTF